MQRAADWFAITASLLGTLTSLAVWTTLADNPNSIAQLSVSVVALLGAAGAAFPRVRNYGEAAGTARELASQYGTLLGRLIDAQLVASDSTMNDAVRNLVGDFESLKARKDQLVPYPAKEQKARDEQKSQARTH